VSILRHMHPSVTFRMENGLGRRRAGVRMENGSRRRLAGVRMERLDTLPFGCYLLITLNTSG
jgi:hypothetical protein